MDELAKGDEQERVSSVARFEKVLGGLGDELDRLEGRLQAVLMEMPDAENVPVADEEPTLLGSLVRRAEFLVSRLRGLTTRIDL
jgi:hypothetical protein